jgi:hypothetical protein
MKRGFLLEASSCEICGRYSTVPYPECWYCHAAPSWHHGRCCLQKSDVLDALDDATRSRSRSRRGGSCKPLPMEAAESAWSVVSGASAASAPSAAPVLVAVAAGSAGAAAAALTGAVTAAAHGRGVNDLGQTRLEMIHHENLGLWRCEDRDDLSITIGQLSVLAFGALVNWGDRFQNRRTRQGQGVTCRVFNDRSPKGRFIRDMEPNEQFEALMVHQVWIPKGGSANRHDPARWGLAVQTHEGWVNISKGKTFFAYLIQVSRGEQQHACSQCRRALAIREVDVRFCAGTGNDSGVCPAMAKIMLEKHANCGCQPEWFRDGYYCPQTVLPTDTMIERRRGSVCPWCEQEWLFENLEARGCWCWSCGMPQIS